MGHNPKRDGKSPNRELESLLFNADVVGQIVNLSQRELSQMTRADRITFNCRADLDFLL